MKRTFLAVLSSFLVLASVSAASADDEIRIFSFLSSRQEVQEPPVEVRSFGIARGDIYFEDDKAWIGVDLLLRLRAGTEITRFHIHRGARGANGPIVVNFFDTVDVGGREVDPEPIPTGKRFTRVSFELEVDPELAAEIAAFGREFYFNVHTDAFAAGEVRGQLLTRFDD